MDVYEIRLKKLRDIADEYKSITKLGEAVNRSQSQMSQIIGENPSRTIGSKVARDIEKRLGLKRGYLDTYDDSPEESIKSLIIKSKKQRLSDMICEIESEDMLRELNLILEAMAIQEKARLKYMNTNNKS